MLQEKKNNNKNPSEKDIESNYNLNLQKKNIYMKFSEKKTVIFNKIVSHPSPTNEIRISLKIVDIFY